MFHSTCHAALGHGQPCSQEISCKLAHRGLRCATARDGVRSCRCKEDTRWGSHLTQGALNLKAILFILCRWDGGDCVHSPGSNKDPVRDSLAVSDEEGAEEEEDRSSNDDISRVLNKLFGSLGFLIVVLLIIGVCIVLHNHK